MKLEEAKKIVEASEKIFLDNRSPRYYIAIGEVSNIENHAIEVANCDIANWETNWHCQCQDEDCGWYQHHQKKWEKQIQQQGEEWESWRLANGAKPKETPRALLTRLAREYQDRIATVSCPPDRTLWRWAEELSEFGLSY